MREHNIVVGKRHRTKAGCQCDLWRLGFEKPHSKNYPGGAKRKKRGNPPPRRYVHIWGREITTIPRQSCIQHCGPFLPAQKKSVKDVRHVFNMLSGYSERKAGLKLVSSTISGCGDRFLHHIEMEQKEALKWTWRARDCG